MIHLLNGVFSHKCMESISIDGISKENGAQRNFVFDVIYQLIVAREMNQMAQLRLCLWQCGEEYSSLSLLADRIVQKKLQLHSLQKLKVIVGF